MLSLSSPRGNVPVPVVDVIMFPKQTVSFDNKDAEVTVRFHLALDKITFNLYSSGLLIIMIRLDCSEQSQTNQV